jgi:predicted PolB exonuclease-like 3'-5' exonuclease
MSIFEKPTSDSVSMYLKQHQPLVFDIETTPIKDMETWQNEYLEKKFRKVYKVERDLLEPNHTQEYKKLAALDPLTARIVTIGLFYPESNTVNILMDDDEKKMLVDFWSIIATHKGPFISYNGIKFDVPFIIKRSLLYDLYPTNRDFLKFSAYNPLPEHYDLMLILASGKDRENFISLETACNFLGVPSPKNGALKADGVADAFLNKEFDKIKEYCEKDLRATALLYKKIEKFAVKV